MPINGIKKLIFKLSLFAPLILLVILANYLFDPARLFPRMGAKKDHAELRECLKEELKEEPNEYILGMVDHLFRGFNLSRPAHYDQRVFQKYCIVCSQETKNVIVLGSSRAWVLDSRFFPKKRFFNHGVPGATLEDLLAIFNMYEEKKKVPPMIIISVDPWLFQGNKIILWKSIGKDYEAMVKKLEVFSKTEKPPQKELSWSRGIFFEKYFQLVSFSYFQSSVAEFSKTLKERKHNDSFQLPRYQVGSGPQLQYFPTQEIKGEYDIILTDGSLSFPLKSKPADDIRHEISTTLSQGTEPNLGPSYNRMDQNLKEQFERFIDFLQHYQVEVVFFLPPFHPFFYDSALASQKYNGIAETEEYLRKLAGKKKINVIGSYNPRQCFMNEGDFEDYLHAKRDKIGMIFRSALSR